MIVRSATKLNQIAKAIIAYREANNNNFPAAAIKGADGTPLLSWRVAILPFLGESEKALYGQFKLSEPWDSPDNKVLLAKMPKVFLPVVGETTVPHSTYYRVFTGSGLVTAFMSGSTADLSPSSPSAVAATEALSKDSSV